LIFYQTCDHQEHVRLFTKAAVHPTLGEIKLKVSLCQRMKHVGHISYLNRM
jgi:hypothetical protein